MSTAIQEFKGDANRAKVVELRLAGKTLEQIAMDLGLAGPSSAKYHLDVWLAEQKPSSEQTEELRQLQSAKIDSLAARLEPRLDSDDYLAVTDRLVKLMDRKARLMGLDLERNVQVNILPTAEAMASAFGWAGDDAVVEGTAVEVTDA